MVTWFGVIQCHQIVKAVNIQNIIFLCVTHAESVSVQTEQILEKLPFLSLLAVYIDINLQYRTTEIDH